MIHNITKRLIESKKSNGALVQLCILKDYSAVEITAGQNNKNSVFFILFLFLIFFNINKFILFSVDFRFQAMFTHFS